MGHATSTGVGWGVSVVEFGPYFGTTTTSLDAFLLTIAMHKKMPANNKEMARRREEEELGAEVT